MYLRTLLMLLQYYTSYTSVLYSDILKLWQPVVPKHNKVPSLSLRHTAVFHCGSFQQLRSHTLTEGCTAVSLTLGITTCQIRLQSKAVRTKDHQWNLWHYTAATCVPSSRTTLRGTALKHMFFTHGLTEQYLLHDTIHCIWSVISHTPMWWVLGETTPMLCMRKRRFLTDTCTLIEPVNPGTDWDPDVLCTSQTVLAEYLRGMQFSNTS